MEVLREYPDHHHYLENYEKTPYFCPNCGNMHVWEDTSSGDYYSGPDYCCTACSHFFHLPSGAFPARDHWQKQVVEQLQLGRTFTPTTPRGR